MVAIEKRELHKLFDLLAEQYSVIGPCLKRDAQKARGVMLTVWR
jgi:hypothetical protein